MTNVIQQQNKFLAETKQRIIHNVNDVDEMEAQKSVAVTLGDFAIYIDTPVVVSLTPSDTLL
jgi:hypothetical protein